MKKPLYLLIMLFMVFALGACGPNNTQGGQTPPGDAGVTSMNLKINDKTFTVNLESNATTKALVNMLPLTINMTDLNGNEKYHYLQDSLPTNASRVAYINAGDVMLYGDSCLVIFYKSFSSGYSYTKIGHIESIDGLMSALGSGSVQVVWSV